MILFTKYAEEDIAYLRSLSTLPPVSTIFGTVWRYTHDPNFKPKFRPSLMDHYRPPEQDYLAMERNIVGCGPPCKRLS